ncbi:MAG: hypothetical protein P1U56_12565 [Saprospiraceae bacterium]|nr:hypothetical protein [Saprospiraceae bacterium]
MIKKDKSSYCKRLFFLFCVLFFGTSLGLSAQLTIYGIAEKYNDRKHGKVITYEPMKSVIMDCQGDTLTFDLNEYDFRFTTRKPPKKYMFPDGVYYHRIALGVLPGNPGDGGYVNYTYHYQRNRLLGYGGGISFENYGDVDGYDFLVPSVVFYSYFSEKNTSPFLRFTTGYGIAIKNTSKFQTKAQGGINLGAAVGLRLSTNRIMIDFSAGARFQKAFYEFDFGEFSKITDARFQRFDFSVGFMW